MLELTTPENTITYHNGLFYHPKILHKDCFQFLLGPFELPRETEDNAYAKFWGDKQRVLWYVMVFSVVVNYCLPLPYPAVEAINLLRLARPIVSF